MDEEISDINFALHRHRLVMLCSLDMTRMVDTQDEFDFSEYPSEHPLYSKQNIKVIGKFKDELHGCAMTKFVGLRPK